MRTGLTIAALAVSIALAACTRTLDPPTPEEQARESHATIVSGANTLLLGDRLGYDASDDEVDRVNTTCEGDSCAIGFLSVAQASRFSVENWELELLRERRGVTLVRQDVSGTYGDAEAYRRMARAQPLRHPIDPVRQRNRSRPGRDDRYELFARFLERGEPERRRGLGPLGGP